MFKYVREGILHDGTIREPDSSERNRKSAYAQQPNTRTHPQMIREIKYGCA